LKAIWEGTVIAQSDETIVVEGNHYFPAESISEENLIKTNQEYFCGWKGKAFYYDIMVDGKINESAAWSYPCPEKAAREITGHFGFWKGVQILQE
jgi:uncharacterized protein (DUF427 family)